MGIAEAIANILATGLKMTEDYINDPKRRLEARLKAKEKMKEKVLEIIKGNNIEETDKMLIDFLALINSL